MTSISNANMTSVTATDGRNVIFPQKTGQIHVDVSETV